MPLICELPYRCINIDEYGEVHPCCVTYCSHYSFGNILKEQFSEIWNGEKAQNFRKQFIEKDYKYCNLDVCLPHRSNDDSINLDIISQRRPVSVLLGYDRTCNVNCIFCKPQNNQRYLKPFEIIEERVIDLFRDVKYVNIASAGEAFASNHSKKLIKKIAQIYPSIKFDILTNGMLFNEKNLDELEISDKLNLVGISFHSFNKSTYNKIVKNSDYEKVMKNIEYAVKLKNENKINTLEFRAVITSYNYKEMINFAKKSKKNNARVVFLNLIQYEMPTHVFKELDVINPKNKHYNQFTKILKNPIFKESFVTINPALLLLKPNSFFSNVFKF